MGDKLLATAWEALVANKVRAALTMLGIIIGVMSVVVLVALGQASQAYITNEVQGLGAGVLFVSPGNPKGSSMGPPGMNTAQTLTLDDVDAIEKLPGVRYVTPSAETFTDLKVGNKQMVYDVTGTTPTMQEVQSVKIGKGRFFTDQEARQGRRVVVIGARIADELFTKQALDPFTDRLKIEGQRYRVIGVLKEQGGTALGSIDEIALIPIAAFQQNLQAGKQLNMIMVKSERMEAMAAVSERIQRLLRQRHKIRPDEDDDFVLQTQEDILKTVETITQVFTFLLAGIASISLLVGGIGIMNIMLVSVTERTREIGIRKAVGAKRRDILTQFLIESAALALAGGTIGILLGMALTYAATRAASLPFVVSPVAIIGAFVFSATVGIFFGLYPANKAAKLDPVEALRYE